MPAHPISPGLSLQMAGDSPPALRELRSGPRWLVDAPRWLLVAGLVFAPWAYGCTGAVATLTLNAILGLVCLFWIGECAVRRRRPALPPVLLGAVALLLTQGWWMTLNAQFYYDYQWHMLMPREAISQRLAGSAERGLSLGAMLNLTSLAGAMLFCCDLFQRPEWRKRVWITMALAGCSIALCGIVLKLGGPPAMALLWPAEKIDMANNFATFRYRANAGAFLNLALPLVAGLVFLAFQKPGRPGLKAVWLSMALLLAFAIQLNPSRAGWAIALGLSGMVAARIFWHGWKDGFLRSAGALNWIYGAIAALLVLALGALSFLGGWVTSWDRIRSAGLDTSERSPTEVYASMVPDAGWLGFGPGTFSAVFPGYQATYDFAGRAVPQIWKEGLWWHAHHDYYQTLIEWGHLGMALWTVIVGGALVSGLFFLRRRRTNVSHRWFVFCAAAALSGVLAHAMVDFPLQVPSIQLFAAVMIALLWASPGTSWRAPETPGNSSRA